MSEKESFSDFKDSFFYGSRSDMSFKFLEHLSEVETSDFLQHFFRAVVDGLDRGELKHIQAALIEGQAAGYRQQKNFAYDTGPFTPLEKNIEDIRLTMITSSGHFVAGDDPMPFGVADMSQEEAESRIMDSLKEEPILSAIPFSTPPEKLRVRHGGYDIRAALLDANVTLPLQRLLALRNRGEIGGLTEKCYSFVGACSQKMLISKVLPGWIEKIRLTGADAVLLVPV